MERGLGVAPHPVEDLVVGLDAGARRDLAVVELGEPRLAQDVARDPDRLDPFLLVVGRRQVVEEHRRVLTGVGRTDLHVAAGVGVHRPDVHLVAVALRRHAPVVPDGDRQEVEHEVRVVDVVVAPDEAAALEVVGGAQAATVDEPLVPDLGAGAHPQTGCDRHRLLRRVLDVDLEVVLEVRTDTRDIRDDVDAEGAQVVGVAHPGQLQELGRVDRPTAQDDLTGRDLTVQPATPSVVDADRAVALEPDAGDERQGVDREVLPVPHRVQVGASGRQTAAPVEVAVEPREPLLPVAVDVVGQRVAGVLDGLEEGTEERVVGRTPLEDQRTLPATPVVGAGEAGLHPLEVGQAVLVVPRLHARLGAPALVVQRVAPLEDHPVDAAGAAEHLAPGVVDAAVVHVGLGVGLVLPVVEPVPDRDGQSSGHVDEGVDPEVGPTGFEDQDRGARVLRQAVGQRTSGGATAHDHHVVALGHRVTDRSRRRRPARTRRTSAARWAGCCARCAWSRGTPPGRARPARGPRRTACSRPTRPGARRGGSR